MQPRRHRCIVVAYLSSASANHLPDSDLTKAASRKAPISMWFAGGGGVLSVYDSTTITSLLYVC